MSDATAGVTTHWRARPAHEFVSSQLGDDYAVYHRPSGRTHFLNAAAADLLERVLLQPRTAAAAAAELAAGEGAPGSAEFVAVVAESLSRLEYLGLIERCEP